jgi:iron complex outermembrane receptor protein
MTDARSTNPGLLVTMSVCSILALGASATAFADTKVQLDIPAQDLGSALKALGAAANEQVLFSNDVVSGLHSVELKGEFTPDQAIQKLLAGTELRADRTESGVYLIRPAAAPVTSNGSQLAPHTARPEGSLPAREASLDSDGQSGLGTSSRIRIAQSEQEPAVPARPGSSLGAQGELQEVTVTANKLGAARLVDVPVSITAIGEDVIDRAGMGSFVDYARRVPGLGFQSLSAAGDRDDIRGGRRLNLRGIESGYDGVPTVAYYIDDAPIPVMDPKLFDIERIEVLRGPQGTLYGANSMGGAIRLVMNKPDYEAFETRGDATVSSTSKGEESYTLNGVLNVPLVEDKVAVRAVTYYRFGGGFIDNVLRQNPAGTRIVERDINDEKSWGARFSLGLKPTESLTITPSVFRQKTRIEYGNEFQNDFSDLSVFNKRVATPENNNFTLYSAEVRWESGNWEVFSATSYFESDFDSVEDATDFYFQFGIVTPDEIARNLQAIRNERLSEEFRISYRGERFGTVVGAFYLDEDRFFEQDFPRSYGDRSRPDFFYGTQANEEEQLAVFGETTFKMTDRTSLTAGLRWFRGDQAQDTQFYSGGVLDPKPIIESSASSVSPKLQFSFKPTDDRLLYVSATKGFRPGGPNAAVPLSPDTGCPEALAELGFDAAPAQYDPDELWSYEVGSKLKFERGGSLNVSAYSIDWTEVQQTVFLGAFATGQCGFTFLGNVGKAKSQGIETEFAVNVTDRFSIGGSVGYTDSKFTESNDSIGISSGERLPLVPKTTASANVQYSFPILGGREAYLYADVSYRDRILDGLSAYELDAFSTVNARMGAQITDRAELVLFADNLLDERGQLNLFVIPPGGPLAADLLDNTITNRPRTIGVTLRYGF